jgi:hypothetical protein
VVFASSRRSGSAVQSVSSHSPSCVVTVHGAEHRPRYSRRVDGCVRFVTSRTFSSAQEAQHSVDPVVELNRAEKRQVEMALCRSVPAHLYLKQCSNSSRTAAVFVCFREEDSTHVYAYIARRSTPRNLSSSIGEPIVWRCRRSKRRLPGNSGTLLRHLLQMKGKATAQQKRDHLETLPFHIYCDVSARRQPWTDDLRWRYR